MPYNYGYRNTGNSFPVPTSQEPIFAVGDVVRKSRQLRSTAPVGLEFVVREVLYLMPTPNRACRYAYVGDRVAISGVWEDELTLASQQVPESSENRSMATSQFRQQRERELLDAAWGQQIVAPPEVVGTTNPLLFKDGQKISIMIQGPEHLQRAFTTGRVVVDSEDDGIYIFVRQDSWPTGEVN